MSMSTRRLVAVVFVSAWATASIAFAQPVHRPARPAARSGSGSDSFGLPVNARQIYEYAKKALPGELEWKQIPWLIDLDEGLRQAKEENRPLLLFVSGDDPLERC
jgi:hypothetical protein